MSVKFIELNPITTPVADDVLVLTDVSEGTSKHITFSNLRQAIIDVSLFTDNAEVLVNAINEYNDGTGNNGLDADKLDGQQGLYYLNYNNFTNTPDIAVDLQDLINSTGFVRYDNDTSPAQLVYENTTGVNATKITVRSDNVVEGVDNLYYTDGRVAVFFDNNFANYFNQYTFEFDDSSAQDSLIDADGTFVDLDVQAQFVQSNRIELTDGNLIGNYSVGQVVRLYGASDISTPDRGEVATTFSITPVGFSNSGETVKTYSYRIAEFSYETGTISAASNNITVSIGIPANLVGTVSTVEDAFNLNNFVRITYSSVPSNTGLLVYRSVAGAAHKLFAVLGPKEIISNAGSYVDFYNFDYTSWSGKNAVDNTYFDTLVHFPVTAPSTVRKGWVDRTVAAVDPVTESITLDDYVKVNPGSAVEISHNDTSRIQTAINSNSAINRRELKLNARDYVVGELLIPSNFSINGSAYITKFIKMPWSGFDSGIPSARVINSQDDSNAENISLVSFDIDGNLTNQFLFDDTTNLGKNYAIDLGIGCVSPLIDKVRLRNVIGSGVYSPEATDTTIVNSEFAHSGTSDRYDFFPLSASGSSNFIVANNKFENFTSFVDMSISNKGVASNNIINNCGSGLLTYGSTYLISSPNILIGPAGEFLSTPDILNSRFDSVNIRLELDTQYASDVYKYTENGVPFDLAQGIGNKIIYELFKLSKTQSGEETLYEKITDVSLSDIPTGVDRAKGEFKFAISNSHVNEILTTYSVNNLIQTNDDHIGLVYRVQLEEHVKAGDLDTETAVTTFTNNSSANTSTYTVNVDNADYLFVGATVELLEHGIDSTTGLSSTATISNISGSGSSVQITVGFEGQIERVGSGGSINIINDFTLVQGRVL